MELSSHCWQGFRAAQVPMAVGGKGRLGWNLPRCPSSPTHPVICFEEGCFLMSDIEDAWTLLPFGLLGKPWNVSLG